MSRPSATVAEQLGPEVIRWRSAGPSRGGRVVAVAGDPQDRSRFWMGACAGGVWTTDDAGQYWRPVSDGFLQTASVGAIEAGLDADGADTADGLAQLEAVNAAVIRLKDAVWAVSEDRVRTARAVADLADLALSAPVVARLTCTRNGALCTMPCTIAESEPTQTLLAPMRQDRCCLL